MATKMTSFLPCSSRDQPDTYPMFLSLSRGSWPFPWSSSTSTTILGTTRGKYPFEEQWLNDFIKINNFSGAYWELLRKCGDDWQKDIFFKVVNSCLFYQIQMKLNNPTAFLWKHCSDATEEALCYYSYLKVMLTPASYSTVLTLQIIKKNHKTKLHQVQNKGNK